jgi:hypothetical protein
MFPIVKEDKIYFHICNLNVLLDIIFCNSVIYKDLYSHYIFSRRNYLHAPGIQKIIWCLIGFLLVEVMTVDKAIEHVACMFYSRGNHCSEFPFPLISSSGFMNQSIHQTFLLIYFSTFYRKVCSKYW